jgi:hypothetical protein
VKFVPCEAGSYTVTTYPSAATASSATTTVQVGTG